MSITYRVRFVCYQYNCGGHLTNGDKLVSKDFTSLAEATTFVSEVKRQARRPDNSVPAGSNVFASNFVHDGFVERFVGVYKITEEKVNL